MTFVNDEISAVLFESGRFTRSDSIWVWQILAGSTIGLLASTWGRLYSSTFYALRDTRTPLRYAIVRVALTTVLGLVAALRLPGWLGLDPKIGVAGLTASAGIAGWVEFYLLRRAITRHIGPTGIKTSFTMKLWIAAFLSAAIAWGVKLGLPSSHRVIIGLVILAAYGLSFLVIATLMRIPEATSLVSRLRSRV